MKSRCKTPYARRMREKRRAAAKRLDLRMQGLTRRGTPRKLEVWPKHLFHGCKSQADKHAVRMRVRGQANLAAGLRYDGKPRKYKRWSELDGLPSRERQMRRQVAINRERRARLRITPLDLAWREFRWKIVTANERE